jgi:hypothetical protein
LVLFLIYPAAVAHVFHSKSDIEKRKISFWEIAAKNIHLKVKSRENILDVTSEPSGTNRGGEGGGQGAIEQLPLYLPAVGCATAEMISHSGHSSV